MPFSAPLHTKMRALGGDESAGSKQTISNSSSHVQVDMATHTTSSTDSEFICAAEGV